MKPTSIILIHGNFVNDKTWADWKQRYEQKGYKVYTPANPGHNGVPSELRKNLHPDLIRTGFKDVVNNIIKLIDTLPEKPVVIGHSMAGMAALKLVELGKAAAGVSIDGAPPKNVFPPFQTLKTYCQRLVFSRLPVISWEAGSGTITLSSILYPTLKRQSNLKSLPCPKAIR